MDFDKISEGYENKDNNFVYYYNRASFALFGFNTAVHHLFINVDVIGHNISEFSCSDAGMYHN